MKRKFLIGSFVILIVFFFIVLYSYLEYSEPEYQKVGKKFVQNYLKPEYWPSSINLTLGLSRSLDKPDTTFYGYYWTTPSASFYLRVEYNKNNNDMSGIILVVSDIPNIPPSELVNKYFNILVNPIWDCEDISATPSSYTFCKYNWEDSEKNRFEFADFRIAQSTLSITFCKLFKESEKYEKGCFY